MSLDVTVRVNNVIFRSREPEGQVVNGFYIDDLGFDGWNDGTDIRRDEVEIPQGHGSFDLPGFLTPRIVTLSGACWADTPEQLGWFRSQLTGLLADGQSGRIVVEQAGETQWADARLAAATRTAFAVRAEDARSATFEIMFWCANPRKYGEAKTFAAGEPAYHYGNFPAIPVFTISGDMPGGYAIDGPDGKQFRVTKPLVPGEPHVVDMATGWLTVNGAVQTGVIARGDLWAIPGGSQVRSYVTPITSGSASTSILVRSTYI